MVQNIRSCAHTLHGAVCFLGDASGRRLAILDGTMVKEFSPYARVLLPFQRGQRHTPMSGASRPSHFCNRNPGVESLRRFESRSATNQERDGHGENSESFVSKQELRGTPWRLEAAHGCTVYFSQPGVVARP